MKGLILKDLYLIMKYCKAVLVFMAIFIGVSAISDSDSTILFTFYPCIIAGLFPMTLCSYDEKEKWNIYSQTLPISKAQYVSGKYIIGLIFIALALFLAAAAQGVHLVRDASFGFADYGTLLCSIAMISLLAPSILLPFVFKLGVEKGRILYYFVMIAAFASSFLLADNSFSLALSLSNTVGMLLIGGGTVLLYLLSWLLSIAFYRRREL